MERTVLNANNQIVSGSKRLQNTIKAVPSAQGSPRQSQRQFLGTFTLHDILDCYSLHCLPNFCFFRENLDQFSEK